jgi:hypothetical protein
VHESIEDLEKALDAFLRQLENFFVHLFESMEDKKLFRHVIAMMGKVSTMGKNRMTYDLSLMAVSFLPEY